VLAEYQKAPVVTRDRLYIDSMQQIYANVTKVLVDSKNNSNLLYLPLDRLLQQQTTAAPAASGAATTAVPESSSPAVVDVRSRDGSRSRDREGR
jgi:membrane protease subunit HflK